MCLETKGILIVLACYWMMIKLLLMVQKYVFSKNFLPES